MWVPASLAYLVAGLAIVARWLRMQAPPPSHRTGDSRTATLPLVAPGLAA